MFQRIQVTHTRFTIHDLMEKTYLPKFQRMDDREHTERIVQGLCEYYFTHGELVLIGAISLADMKKEKHILLDGQHRLRALEQVVERIPELRWNFIRCDVYEVSSEEEAKGIYNIINSSKKVELYTGDSTPFIVPEIQRYFRDRYPEYCKTSKKPLGLNINLDTLAKHLLGKHVIQKLQLDVNGADLLIQKIRDLNQYYSDQPPEKFLEWGVKDYDKRYRELLESRDPFYLGLFRQYEWIDRLSDPRPFDQQSHTVHHIKRRDVPATTRRKLWEARFGQSVSGPCYCCGNTIRLDEFHAAHRISAFDGGSNEIDNLEPTCSHCNLEMSTMNIEDYKKLFHLGA
jgi:hypothetical protein